MVFISDTRSWLRRPGSPAGIFDWWNPYAEQNYDMVSVADIFSNRVEYYWDVKTYCPHSQVFIAILKRKAP